MGWLWVRYRLRLKRYLLLGMIVGGCLMMYLSSSSNNDYDYDDDYNNNINNNNDNIFLGRRRRRDSVWSLTEQQSLWSIENEWIPVEGTVPSRFFLCWTTEATGWQARHSLVLDALFLHHPKAIVYFLTTHLPTSHFHRWQHLGYRIHAVSLRPSDVLDRQRFWIGPHSERWLRRFLGGSQAEQSVYGYSHFTDYLRFICLYRFGGTYMDMDALTLHPFPHNNQHPYFVGVDQSETQADWFLEPQQGRYLAPGLFRMAAGDPELLRQVEESFRLDVYDPSCFNCVGPKLFNLFFRRLTSTQQAQWQVFPPYELYPNDYLTAHELFQRRSDSMMYASKLMLHSTSLHLFGKVTRHQSVEVGSVVDLLSLVYGLTTTTTTTTKTAGSAQERQTLLEQAPFLKTRLFPDISFDSSFDSTSTSTSVVWLSYTSPVVLVPHRPPTQRAFMQLQGPHTLFVRWRHSTPPPSRRPPTLRVELIGQGQLLPDDDSDPTQAGQLLLLTGTTLAELNACLHSLALHVTTSIRLRVYEELISASTSLSLHLLADMEVVVFQEQVTFVTHTTGRFTSIQNAYHSIQQQFPGARMLVSHDDDAEAEVENLIPVDEGVEWIRLEKDAGLSAGRNALVRHVTTPFVFLMDDDFELTHESLLELLLERALRLDADIVAGKIPHDIQHYLDFQGLLQVDPRRGHLSFLQGSHATIDGCQHVDFVPNVFLGRTETLKAVEWDPELKLGEHEDFFYRLSLYRRHRRPVLESDTSSRASLQPPLILSCPHVTTHHAQTRWWDDGEDKAYQLKRSRVFHFQAKALRKHGLKELFYFGTSQLRLE